MSINLGSYSVQSSSPAFVPNWYLMWTQLDQIFPFFLFAYGFLLIFIFESGLLTKLKTASVQRISEKQVWAWVCMMFGGLWSLQTLFF